MAQKIKKQNRKKAREEADDASRGNGHQRDHNQVAGRGDGNHGRQQRGVAPATRAQGLQVRAQTANANELDGEEMRDNVPQRAIPTAVADTGASSNCDAAPLVSTCGDYEIADSPFLPTGKESDRTFRNASGGLNPATEIRELPMDVRPPANLVHMVPGFRDNLLSTGKFVDTGYAWIFDQDEVCVYDMKNTKITTSRAAIMKGWRVPEEGVWRFALLPTAIAPTFDSQPGAAEGAPAVAA